MIDVQPFTVRNFRHVLVRHGFQKFRHVVDVNWGDTSKALIDLLQAPVTSIDWHASVGKKFGNVVALGMVNSSRPTRKALSYLTSFHPKTERSEATLLAVAVTNQNKMGRTAS